MPQFGLGLVRDDVRPAPRPQLRRLSPKTDHVVGAIQVSISQPPERRAHISTLPPTKHKKVQVQLTVFFALEADRDLPTQDTPSAAQALLPATV